LLNQPPRRRLGALLVTGLALVVVAAGLLVWSVIGMVSAGDDVDGARQAATAASQHLKDLREDDAVEVKTVRDQALQAGRKGVVTMNTLDYREIDAGLDEWERITTGDLHDEVVNGRAQSKQAITNARSVTEAKVLSSAVQDVNAQAGTAIVLVALKVDISTAGADPTSKYMRMKTTLQRTDQGWKLAGIGQVPFQQ
jgi:Mce-associated membrane protein